MTERAMGYMMNLQMVNAKMTGFIWRKPDVYICTLPRIYTHTHIYIYMQLFKWQFIFVRLTILELWDHILLNNPYIHYCFIVNNWILTMCFSNGLWNFNIFEKYIPPYLTSITTSNSWCIVNILVGYFIY